MRKIRTEDVVGKTFGELSALKEIDARAGQRVFQCLCECGKVTEVLMKRLRSGRTRSCGCLSLRKLSQRAVHGMWKHKLYSTWSSARGRCHNERHKNYKGYGGRGIELCSGWRETPEAFIEWIENNLGEKPEGYSLDRINNEGNYEPGNLRWASTAEQNNNTRKNKMISHEGKELQLKEWAEEKQLSMTCLYNRLHRGWTTKETLDTPKGGVK